MPIQGDVKNLYSDREKTRALFPTTKVSAVSDDNGVGLDALMENLLYSGIEVPEASSVPLDADTLEGHPASDFATPSFVTSEIAKAQLSGGSGGDIDLSGFATKDDVNNAVRAIDFPVDSVNGKTGAVQLSASEVGARSSTWLPTIEQIGAAPAGIVSKTIKIASETELDNALAEEINTMANDSARFLVFAPTSSSVFGGVAVLCRLYKRSDSGYGTADFIGYATHGPNTWQKSWYGGTWKPIEWVNPPMAFGVEYRTTERHNGHPVYTKMIDCGKGTSTGAMNLYPGAGTNVVYINFNCRAVFDSGWGTLLNDHLSFAGYGTNDGTVSLSKGEDLSKATIYLTVKYYKV